MDRDAIVRLDRAHVWHPYTPVDRWEETDPIVVASAAGPRLRDLDGKEYLDGNSSWYVADLGHGHPRILRALREQAEKLAHVALAGITHEPAAALAAELVAAAPRGLTRVFYTDNGSTSVEVAVKIALQTWQNLGAPEKKRFVALEGAYHGDTVAATSLGDVEVFKKPYAGVLFECVRAPFPDSARAMEAIADVVSREAKTIAAVVVEPMVQGTAGMRMHASEHLAELRRVTREHDVLLVCDEVFTGYGRTGRMWACEHADVAPDLMCLGKAFAAIVPMGATLVTDRVYDAFRGREDALWYGHTFCGNPIGAALAREVLAIYRDERIVAEVQRKAPRIAEAFARIGAIPGVARTRALGMIGAADLRPEDRAPSGYLGRAGWRVFDEARRRGAYLRPLGDTVYVCPPLVISDAELDALLGILEESVRAALR